MLLHGGLAGICRLCKSFRHQLQTKAVRQDTKALASSQSPSRYAPNVALSTPQKLAKLAALAREKSLASHKVRQLQDRIAKLNEVNGIDVEEELDSDHATIMDMESEKVCSTFPEGSFKHLFWKQQMEARLATTPQQRRWHLLLIKWLLKFTHDLICSLSQSPHIRHVAVAIRVHPT